MDFDFFTIVPGYERGNRLPDKNQRIEDARDLEVGGFKRVGGIACKHGDDPYLMLHSELKYRSDRTQNFTPDNFRLGPFVLRLESDKPFAPDSSIAIWKKEVE